MDKRLIAIGLCGTSLVIVLVVAFSWAAQAGIASPAPGIAAAAPADGGWAQANEDGCGHPTNSNVMALEEFSGSPYILVGYIP